MIPEIPGIVLRVSYFFLTYFYCWSKLKMEATNEVYAKN